MSDNKWEVGTLGYVSIDIAGFSLSSVAPFTNMV